MMMYKGPKGDDLYIDGSSDYSVLYDFVSDFSDAPTVSNFYSISTPIMRQW